MCIAIVGSWNPGRPRVHAHYNNAVRRRPDTQTTLTRAALSPPAPVIRPTRYARLHPPQRRGGRVGAGGSISQICRPRAGTLSSLSESSMSHTTLSSIHYQQSIILDPPSSQRSPESSLRHCTSFALHQPHGLRINSDSRPASAPRSRLTHPDPGFLVRTHQPTQAAQAPALTDAKTPSSRERLPAATCPVLLGLFPPRPLLIVWTTNTRHVRTLALLPKSASGLGALRPEA
ncbi:hypothetical protein C8Q77DRAFT_857134 [Trametes polyzona]|nr:hypothetical protein C8Q77DRAFT_857134 [Trametes polyzona]